ncbi:MAG: glycosyltransferase family 4 protein, partial [Anaerolineae bacterium]
EAARRFRADLMRLEETFRRCDCVLTTTEFLAQEARSRGKPVYVARNAPCAEMFQLSEQAWAERQQQLNQEASEPPVVLAYFSGTGSHNRDFQTIADPLVWVLSTYPQTWLHIGGQLDLGPAFEPFWDRIRRTPYVTWRELPQIIAQTDINLAPLEPDNPFCRAKSEIKFVEAALVGVPTVASRVEAYEHAITHGQDGLLAITSDEWRDALRTLLDHPDQRRDLGDAARRAIYARYTPEQRAEELWGILDHIWQRFAVRPGSEDELQELLVAGFEQYANEMQRHARQQQEQIESLHRALRQYESQLMVAEQRKVYLEDKIEAIMQGRVMRLTTAIQSYWRRISGKGRK